jgi:DNA-binding response OmpR family regulator
MMGNSEKDDHSVAASLNGTETILIAEDDESLRKLMEIVLSGSGYKVIIAIDGDDAVRKFMMNINAVHLCLLDVIMPKKSGIDVYHEIKKVRPDIITVFMSGYTANIMSPLSEENTHLLLKPVEPKTLLVKIRELLDKQSEKNN